MNKTIKEIREKDQFYTKDKVAKVCIESLMKYVEDIRPYVSEILFVEPSAGFGNFYYNFPKDEFKLAFDIDKPFDIKDPYYKEGNFLEVDLIDWYNVVPMCKIIPNAIYAGNPPFGLRGNLAFDFILKCIELNAAIIAFILPPNINTKLRLSTIREKGYEIIHIDTLKSDSFYFYNGEKISDVSAESNFQIYMRKDLIEKTNNDIIVDVNLKNDDFVQVYTINDNEIFNTERDTKDKKFVQKGVGTKWIGKCDFYIPLRVFNSAGKPTHKDSFMDDFFSNIGFGVICQDKDIKNKINVENCYAVGINKVRIAKKQLILKEIMRVNGSKGSEKLE